MNELDETGTRRLLAYLTAAAVAGGQPVHEVENDIRRLARRLGHPGVQVDASPTGVVLSLGGGTPATFEAVEGALRLDQSADTYALRTDLEAGIITPTETLARLQTLRHTPTATPGAAWRSACCAWPRASRSSCSPPGRACCSPRSRAR
ncbi:threonine/serine exporter family protein [Mobilicoccus caccae]|uniref:Threonine/serine exporter-like N-terminal domain-containing protein n=1 Tax=Mobilicoccus caccae TaxID=1859295 RepID=A0ABQ6IWG2_9MICO|nr:threonine/serine exporter family protein [Mobilicoccus caccae]GMA42294.1 hypothetical protein GCM10025883_43390 [Mobilicoccus caccae]